VILLLRRGLLAAFAVGLGSSSIVAKTALRLLMLLWLWRFCHAEDRRRQPWPLWQPLLAFASVTVLSALATDYVAVSLAACKGLLLMGALYVTADAFENPRDGDRFVSWLALAAAGAALAGLVQYGACPPQDPADGLARWFFHRCYRPRGFYKIYMTLAGVLNIMLLVTLPRVLPGRFRAWSVPVWLLTLAGLVMAYTRGAWVGFAVGAAALLLMVSRRGRIALLVSLALLPLIFLLGPRDLRHRFRSSFDLEEAGIKERVYMWRSGVNMWRERPLLGWGPAGVKREYTGYALPEAYKRRTGHVHNTPLQILVERGALGLAAWLAIWIAFYWRSSRLFRGLEAHRESERALVAGSIAGVTGFLVAGLSEYNFGDSVVMMTAFAVMSLPWAVDRGLSPAADPGKHVLLS